MKALKQMKHWQFISLYLVIYDILAVNFAYFFALWLRFDCRYSMIPAEYLERHVEFMPIYTAVTILIFMSLHLYRSIWRFASYSELGRCVISMFVTTAVSVIGMTFFIGKMPISYFVVGGVVQFVAILGIRFSYRLVQLQRSLLRKVSSHPEKNVMIIGAGAAGLAVVREIHGSRKLQLNACCIIDDNPNKWNRYIDGVPVVGGRNDIMMNVEKYDIDQIMYAIPTAKADERREILNICKETDCEIKVLPGIYQLVNGDVSVSQMKPITVEDLLGRDTIQVNNEEIFNYIQGKTILVTGGGGSIGSELCRQIAAHSPKQLIIFEVYENNAYDIEQELRRKYPNLNLLALIGSVRDSRRINAVFEKYKPDIVYHAAAHKHVPLMETSPCEAIKNNVMGTYKTAYAALHNGCKRFVLISTDKAVNPTNIMGASKRMCEMVVQGIDWMCKNGKEELLPNLGIHEKNEKSEKIAGKKTEFVAVRFGNVLGSNGSVIPLFRKQIAAGGPVTVTHPDIIRYFMTIPEAVGLVLQAGYYAKGGEIFVLDMGAPMKIDTLARNLIKLSGYQPDVDIKIVYTGLRPGEKLYEEKLMEEEGMQKTPNELIHIGSPIEFDVEGFFGNLESLIAASYMESKNLYGMVKNIVPTFHTPEEDIKENADVFEKMKEEVAVTVE